MAHLERGGLFYTLIVQINKLNKAQLDLVNVLIYLSTLTPKGNGLTGLEKNKDIYLYIKGGKGSPC